MVSLINQHQILKNEKLLLEQNIQSLQSQLDQSNQKNSLLKQKLTTLLKIKKD